MANPLHARHAGFLINGPFNDAFVEGLGDCVNQGLAQAVGVSNFSADRVRRASSILQARASRAAPPYISSSCQITMHALKARSSLGFLLCLGAQQNRR